MERREPLPPPHPRPARGALRVALAVGLACAALLPAQPVRAQDQPPAPPPPTPTPQPTPAPPPAPTPAPQPGSAPGPAAPTPSPPAPPAKPPEPQHEFLGRNRIRRPDGTIVQYYRVNYLAPEVLQRELEFWKGAKTEFAAAGANFLATKPENKDFIASNTLRIVDTEEHWPVVERMLEILDVPQPQVRVEAKVVELTWDDQLKLGMAAKVTRPLGDTFLQSAAAAFPNSLDNVNGFAAAFRSVDKYIVFDYAFQAAAQGVRAEVEAKPTIVACQGETATIDAGDKEPFVVQNLQGGTVQSTVQFEPTGVKLEVEPLLIGRNSVRVRISARASRVSDFRVTATSATQQVVNAVISSRTADTVLTVPDGETVVIGGLSQKTKGETKTGIPLLKDLPVLGYLFGSTSTRNQTSELSFWITLTIERPEESRLMIPPGERERASGGPAPGTPSGE